MVKTFSTNAADLLRDGETAIASPGPQLFEPELASVFENVVLVVCQDDNDDDDDDDDDDWDDDDDFPPTQPG